MTTVLQYDVGVVHGSLLGGGHTRSERRLGDLLAAQAADGRQAPFITGEDELRLGRDLTVSQVDRP